MGMGMDGEVDGRRGREGSESEMDQMRSARVMLCREVHESPVSACIRAPKCHVARLASLFGSAPG